MDLCVLLEAEGDEPRPKSSELVTLIGSLLERGELLSHIILCLYVFVHMSFSKFVFVWSACG